MEMTIAAVDAIATAMLAMNTTDSKDNIWPSLDTASRIFDLSSIALAIGACVVFVSTALIVCLGIVKEHHWDVLREEHREKITLLATKSEKARADVEKAHAEIANANKAIEEARADTAKALAETAKSNERSAELKLALEREIAARQPRQISPEQHVKLVAALSTIVGKGKLTVTWKMHDEESERFARQLLGVLIEAGFDAIDAEGSLSFGPGAMGQAILVREPEKFEGRSWIGSVQEILNDVLGLRFGAGKMDPSFGPTYNDIVIAIGAKP